MAWQYLSVQSCCDGLWLCAMIIGQIVSNAFAAAIIISATMRLLSCCRLSQPCHFVSRVHLCISALVTPYKFSQEENPRPNTNKPNQTTGITTQQKE